MVVDHAQFPSRFSYVPRPHIQYDKKTSSSDHVEISSHAEATVEALAKIEKKADAFLASRKKVVPKVHINDQPFPTYNAQYQLSKSPIIQKNAIDYYI